jgi:hypothetical protein
MKEDKKTSHSTSIFESMLECGTEELRKKHKVEFERIDIRGVFRRARVTDQNKIDCLFLEKKINAQQYGAAEEYQELLLKSGVFLKSPGFEEGPESTGRDKSRSMASRIMAVSGARSRLRRDAGAEATLAVDLTIGANATVDLVLLKKGLDVLVSYFGTSNYEDPRRKR